MTYGVAPETMNFLATLARNARGWGPVGPASPEEGVPDPNELERGQNALRMFGPVAEAAVPAMAPNLLRPMETVKGEVRDYAESLPYQAAGPILGTGGRMVAAYPKVAAAVAGAGLFARPSQAGEALSPAVVKLQEQLRDAGFYKGPIDGLMKGQTQKAKEDFDKAEEKHLRLETERLGKEAAIKETTRLGKEAETKKTQREAGGQRL